MKQNRIERYILIHLSLNIEQLQDKLISVNITRELTRLQPGCVSLHEDYAHAARALMVGATSWSDFVSPSWPAVHDVLNCNRNCEFELHVQTGSNLYPEYRIRAHAEAYYQLNTT